MVIVIIFLWIGSAIAGWNMFWPWLIAPVVVIGIHVSKMMSRMSASKERFGITDNVPGTSMAAPNAKLLTFAFFQHLAIFAAAAGVHWLIA